jgi:hypothetical protein
MITFCEVRAIMAQIHQAAAPTCDMIGRVLQREFVKV